MSLLYMTKLTEVFILCIYCKEGDETEWRVGNEKQKKYISQLTNINSLELGHAIRQTIKSHFFLKPVVKKLCLGN